MALAERVEVRVEMHVKARGRLPRLLGRGVASRWRARARPRQVPRDEGGVGEPVAPPPRRARGLGVGAGGKPRARPERRRHQHR